ELDFSQEDVEFADRSKLYALITDAEELTGKLLQSFQLGNVIRHGVQVAIIGKPNAGKSTLLNTLLNENRAIVSELAGTTRDTIEEILNIEGILFRLIDTAGLRHHVAEFAGHAGADPIESIGIRKSLEKMEQADIVVYVFDINDSPAEIIARRAELAAAGKPFLIVLNKLDTTDEATARAAYPNEVLISARDGRHIDELKQRLVDQVLQGKAVTEGTIITNARHYQALQQVAASLGDIHRGLDNGLSGDLLALDIRRCLHYLGEITGEITSEDQLDYIFSKFCIGK
ncbi:MAG: GTPase, partial [Bacteroidota bacterium]|nr:GTPase [Bacteroidota bacterium]